MKVKQGFVTKRRGFFSKCLFLCCLRLRVNDMTWPICQLCQWSIQCSTYCSTNIGSFYDLPIWAIFGSNLSIWVRRRYQFECGEQMYDYAAWKFWREIHNDSSDPVKAYKTWDRWRMHISFDKILMIMHVFRKGKFVRILLVRKREKEDFILPSKHVLNKIIKNKIQLDQTRENKFMKILTSGNLRMEEVCLP